MLSIEGCKRIALSQTLKLSYKIEGQSSSVVERS